MPVDLSMGFFNVIWQGDANNFVLRSLDITESPAKILNVTGGETLRVSDIANEFGKLFNRDPKFTGSESETALLNNSQHAFDLFGHPYVGINEIVKWTADWLNKDGHTLGKPTSFEVRDGKY